MARQPEWSQTRVASFLTSLATFDWFGERSAWSAITGGELQDERMVSAVWRGTGVVGQQISKGYQASVKRDPKSIGDFLKYITGKIISWDDKPARASINRFYEVATQLKQFPSEQSKAIAAQVSFWEQAESAEERKVQARALMDYVREMTRLNELRLKFQLEDQKERNRLLKELRKDR